VDGAARSGGSAPGGPVRVQALVEVLQAIDHDLEIELRAPPSPAGRAHRAPAVAVGQKLVERVCQRRGIASRHQHPVDAVVDQRREPADTRRHHGQPGVHVLEHGQRRPLEVRAVDGDVERPDHVGHVGPRAEQHHGVRQAELGGGPTCPT